jgi:ABC-type uncharacterized transport system permease subunit
MAIETILGDRSDPTTTNKPDELVESYQIKNSVRYTSASALRIKAIRSADNGSDIRALRQVNSAAGWVNLSSTKFCFALGGKKGSVTITQKELTVDYTGAGCP